MSYAQPGKRQKVRETKTAENVDYFQAPGRIFKNMSDFAEAAVSDEGTKLAEPDIIQDYLKSWGLKMYTPKFKEHGIDFETLLMLTEDNIKEMVPMIGHRAKLIKQLSTVKNMLTNAFPSDQLSDCPIDCSTYTIVMDDSPVNEDIEKQLQQNHTSEDLELQKQGIDKVEYNNMASATETSTFRYYNCTERVHTRTMEEWLKYSVSLTDFRSNGSDGQGRATLNRPWDDNSHTIDNYKRCIKAFYDFCTKLGVKYWTAFDTDLVPPTDNWEENKTNWDDIVEYINELNQRYQVKLLWIAADLHSHPRYASGAFTSNEVTTFVQAATQIKKCLEVSQRLNAECFLLWPYREGYDAIFQTDVVREIKLFAKLLKITAEYKDRLNYRCQLLIMPYSNGWGTSYSNSDSLTWQHSSWGDTLNRYMWDVTSCLYFLKCHNLDRFYKVCTPPGHHMYMANVYNMFGGVTITNKFNCSDVKTVTLMLKCIVDQGGAPPGGINLKLPSRRDSDLRDLITMYVRYMDAFARALRVACCIVAEQVFVKHLQQRYASYYSGFGSRLVSADVTIEECEEFYKKSQSHTEPTCSKPEHYHVVFQRYIDTCEHI